MYHTNVILNLNNKKTEKDYQNKVAKMQHEIARG